MKISRDEVILRMQKNKLSYASLYVKLDDELASLYHITPSGNLVNYMNKKVPQSATFEGYMEYDDIALHPIRVAFTEGNDCIG